MNGPEFEVSNAPRAGAAGIADQVVARQANQPGLTCMLSRPACRFLRPRCSITLGSER
jgi:hypothetical protein